MYEFYHMLSHLYIKGELKTICCGDICSISLSGAKMNSVSSI